MKTGKTISELAAELERQQALKLDFVANTNDLYVEPDAQHLAVRPVVGSVSNFGINDHALRQMGTWANLPAKYADKCLAKAPALLALNLNHWLNADTKSRRMIRVLDGDARAFLSDRYRRIDNDFIAQIVLDTLGNLPAGDVRVESCDVTDSRLYIKAVFPRIQDEVSVGDVVQAGVSITNSEIGLGSMSVMPLVYRLVCSNGMVQHDAGVRRYHVGRRVLGEQEGDGVAAVWQDDTVKADDKALALKVRDTVNAAASDVQFGELVGKLRAAKAGEPMVNPVKGVEILQQTMGFNDGEKTSILETLLRDGDYSRYGALNAVTSAANDHESYDRASELEVMGGRVLNLPASQWSKIAEAA